ncbi:CG31287 [Drosophila busckii]|uniref:CG31287 n=1 Tax=Drosophila busckii TaxID=30019 RepID=A0A0M4ENB4_DROBS|nr:CG31287 [Drosophila busckii]
MCDATISDPMSFLYLDMLISVLIEDTKELKTEFNTKMEFIHEQEQHCLENAKHLIFVDQFIVSLRECVYKLEIELQENENDLLAAEHLVSRAEDSQKLDNIANIPFKPSHYVDLIKLLISADNSAAQCSSLKTEIEQYNSDAAQHEEPLNVSLEEQISRLEKMTENVTKNFAEIKYQLKISSLGTKCVCKMANDMNDMNNIYRS